MLEINHLIGFGVGGRGPSVEHTDYFIDTVANTTFTQTAADIGAADSSRVVILNLVGRESVSGTTTVTATVGGISATQVLTFSDGAKEHRVFVVEVPSGGTTADIVVTTSANYADIAWTVHVAYGGLNLTPYHTDTDATTTATLVINVPAGGFVVATHNANTTADATWSGLTELQNPQYMSLAWDYNLAAETGKTITITQSGTSESCAAASFGWS